MNLEVMQISKVEKQTEQGVVNVYKAVLKGFEFVESSDGDQASVSGTLTLKCEGDPAPLTHYIRATIGDQRVLKLDPVNKTLEDFQK